MFCFIDYRTSIEEKNHLINLGFEIITVPKSPMLYEAINGHVDIQLNIINKKEKSIIINKDLPINFKKLLSKNNINYINSSKTLSKTYPGNIFLNGLSLDIFFIHNLKYTDPILLSTSKNKELIDVKQGYTKCSILPLRDKVIITSDAGIERTLRNYNFDILLIPPGDILLPGLNYGFIGGVGGMINDNSMAFFGDLSKYEFGNEVKKFLFKYDIKPLYLSKSKLIDRGSLFVL